MNVSYRRFSLFCALVFLIADASPLCSQEDPLHKAEAKSSPGLAPATAASPKASPESTTPPLSSAAVPSPGATPPPLTEVLFKNLKARSIGPAVMGGRVSEIALDPRNPFVFYAYGTNGVAASCN
jgi:hypothetical protein